MLLEGAPAGHRARIDRLAGVVVRRRIHGALFLVKPRLRRVPAQTKKLSHPPPFLLQVRHNVLIARLHPRKPFPLPHCQPDIHQIGVMPGGALQREEVRIERIERDVLEITTDHHVPRVSQRDDNPQFRKYPQPDAQLRRRRRVLVQNVPGVLSRSGDALPETPASELPRAAVRETPLTRREEC